MLKRVDLTGKSYKNSGVAMLLGGFDGLHVGHRLLVERARNSGLPVGIMTIVGGKEDKNLFTFQEREDIFCRCGVDFVFELEFSKIKGLSPECFLEILTREFSPQLFVCGEDFRFGYRAQGTPKTIEDATHVRVEILPLVEIAGKKVSSSYIKELLRNGKTEKANALLGEEFFLLGKVFQDRMVGRTMDFPTANIAYPKEKYPLKTGVYETRVSVDGKEYKGITNYGARPTFDDNTVLTETYLDGYTGDLYGRTLKVRFVRFLREIKKFDDITALKKQLQEDIALVRKGALKNGNI